MSLPRIKVLTGRSNLNVSNGIDTDYNIEFVCRWTQSKHPVIMLNLGFLDNDVNVRSSFLLPSLLVTQQAS